MKLTLISNYAFYLNALICSFLLVMAEFMILSASNSGEITIAEIIFSIFECLIIIILIMLLISLLNKKLLLFIPFGIILNFQFFNIHDALSNFMDISQQSLLLAFGMTWIFSAALLWRTNYKDLLNINYIFSLVVFIGSISQVLFLNKSIDYKVDSNSLLQKPVEIKKNFDVEGYSELPNVIYIVPDRYGNLSQLKKNYSYDNSSFYNELEKRGFVFSKDSNSNYPNTYSSLASTLNMTYLVSKDYEINQHIAYPLIKNSLVFNQFKNMGYDFINIDNWWLGTRDNQIADENFYSKNKFIISALTFNLLDRTPIIKLLTRFYPTIDPKYSCSIQKNNFDLIIDKANNKNSGQFIFAHLLSPHYPYLIDSEGKCFTENNKKRRDIIPHSNDSLDKEIPIKAYVEQLKYTNNRLLQIFDEIEKSNNNFIFIIQSDEGPHPYCWGSKTSCDENDWRLKTGIINSFYNTEGYTLNSKDLETPINNFRHIFNMLSEEELELLDHKIYMLKDSNSKKNFKFTQIKYE